MITVSQSQDNFKRGTAEMLILYLLRDEDLYGYQLTQLFAAKSLGTYTMLEGTLYSILFRMVAAGYLSEYEMLVGKKRKRRYYHLEESGKVYFEQLVKEFDVVVAGINRILDRAYLKEPKVRSAARRGGFFALSIHYI